MTNKTNNEEGASLRGITIIIAINFIILMLFPDDFSVILMLSVMIWLTYYSIKTIQKVDSRKLLSESNKSLFKRNADIIEKYKNKITIFSIHYYYIDNETRDCINEICLAENKQGISPGSTYLSSWRDSAPSQWVELSDQIKETFLKKQRDLEELEKKAEQDRLDRSRTLRELEKRINQTDLELCKLISQKSDPSQIQEIHKKDSNKNICINEISAILTPNKCSWQEKEKDLINIRPSCSNYPLFSSDLKSHLVIALNKKITQYNKELEADMIVHILNKNYFKEIYDGYKNNIKENILQRIDYVINDIKFPNSIPKIWKTDFDIEQSILIVEIKLPDVVHRPPFKEVMLKTKVVKKDLNQTEKKEVAPTIQPAIMLRVAYEIFKNDNLEKIKVLVLNGWVEFDDPSTGLNTKAYASSLMVERNQIINLNLKKLEPYTAFTSLKGKSAGKLAEIIPITPTLSLNRKDSRFVDAKAVLNALGTETNLASMDWQDFEHLIRELFEKVFAKDGVEVKVTQASRDRGVDAIVFDPDPIKGGKFIIQAKRYANTVDVSAVRDLCAVVKKEGASRGILVTTSTYGSDAYAFANNEPVTLLNGAELLGLLKQHGYTFRINLTEARKLNIMNQNNRAKTL